MRTGGNVTLDLFTEYEKEEKEEEEENSEQQSDY
jgi:hypothetical protein